MTEVGTHASLRWKMCKDAEYGVQIEHHAWKDKMSDSLLRFETMDRVEGHWETIMLEPSSSEFCLTENNTDLVT